MSSRSPAIRLAGAIEPFTAQVYFSPEAHAAYEALGFNGSRGEFNGVAAPDGPAYFTSRGSVMGQVPGEIVAAAFGVFNPAAVVPSVAHGWSLTDATTIERARTTGGVAQLERILGAEPEGAGRAAELLQRAGDGLGVEGRPLYAGLMACPVPETELGAAWRYGDRLREFRGDAHVAVWSTTGLDAVEIGLLTEPYWGLPFKTYVRSRAWSEAELDAGLERLEARGLVADGNLTAAGRELREQIEARTDEACSRMIANLGDDLDELLSILEPWGAAIREARGYPKGGPHDIAGR
jgi:hypothetical protein